MSDIFKSIESIREIAIAAVAVKMMQNIYIEHTEEELCRLPDIASGGKRINALSGFLSELRRERLARVKLVDIKGKDNAKIGTKCFLKYGAFSPGEEYTHYLFAICFEGRWKYGAWVASYQSQTEYLVNHMVKFPIGKIFSLEDLTTSGFDHCNREHCVLCCAAITKKAGEYEDWGVQAYAKDDQLYCRLVPSAKQLAKQKAAARIAQSEKEAENLKRQREQAMVGRAKNIYIAAKQELQSGRRNEREAGVLLYFVERTTFHVAESLHPTGHRMIAPEEMAEMEKEISRILNA